MNGKALVRWLKGCRNCSGRGRTRIGAWRLPCPVCDGTGRASEADR